MVLANMPAFRFSFWGDMRTYHRSGFRSREHANVPLFSTPEETKKRLFPLFVKRLKSDLESDFLNVKSRFLGFKKSLSTV